MLFVFAIPVYLMNLSSDDLQKKIALTPIFPAGWAENRGSFQNAFFSFHGETVIIYHRMHI